MSEITPAVHMAIAPPPLVASPNERQRGLEALLEHFEGQVGVARKLRLPRLLIYANALLAVVFVAWAYWAEIDQVVHTEGRIVPSAKPQLVQHLEGGIVSKVYVREGDVVKAGDPLVAVSDLMANSTRGEKQARINGLLARAARLQAEAAGRSQFAIPKGLPEKSQELQAERDALSARQSRLHQTVRVLQEQAEQKRQSVGELQVRKKGLSAELEVARQQKALVQNMMNRGAASQSELLEARARSERLTSDIAEAESSLPRLNAAVSELQARIGEINAQYRSEALTALSDTQVELRRLQEDMRTENDRVLRTVVPAPVTGIVNKLLANTVGGVVKPGETLLELTPSDGNVAIETRVSPAEIGNLRTQQSTRVRVTAWDYTLYGTLDGIVREISPDTLVDERGERYFRMSIGVDAQSARSFGKALTPGMTVAGDVIVGQRTVLQYLLSPIRNLYSTALRDRR